MLSFLRGDRLWLAFEAADSMVHLLESVTTRVFIDEKQYSVLSIESLATPRRPQKLPKSLPGSTDRRLYPHLPIKLVEIREQAYMCYKPRIYW